MSVKGADASGSANRAHSSFATLSLAQLKQQDPTNKNQSIFDSTKAQGNQQGNQQGGAQANNAPKMVYG